jgi:peptidoglycan/xylan/chitin deacetylase (PgdA/CDA1 family)
MMRLPKIVEAYYSSLLWRVQTNEKDLYLTFDDGPTPYITKWVLDKLKEYNARATFFCLGKNVRSHPTIFKRILSEGHSVGNHTYDHKNGWETKNYMYMKNVLKCASLVDSDLFRPPYGRISRNQIKALRKQYRIVMWDVLSEDYNQSIPGLKCADIVRERAKEGSIVVFHDSRKAFKNLKIALPEVLKYFHEHGYRFRAIS